MTHEIISIVVAFGLCAVFFVFGYSVGRGGK